MAANPTPGACDALGLGAALAVSPLIGALRSGRSATLAALAYLALTALEFGGFALPRIAFGATALGVAFAYVVARAAESIPGALGRLLESRALVYLGSISYGVYLFHLPIEWFARRLALPWPAPGWARVGVSLVASVWVAAVSWRFFEEPLCRLKRFFPYVDEQVTIPLGQAIQPAARE